MKMMAELIDELKSKISNYETILFEKDETIQNLTIQNNTLTRQNNSLNTSLLETTENLLTESSFFIKRQSVRIDSAQSQLKTLQKENDRLKREKSSLQEQVEELTSANTKLMSLNLNLEREIEEIDSQMKNMKQTCFQFGNYKELSIENLNLDTSLNNIQEVRSCVSVRTGKQKLNMDLLRSRIDSTPINSKKSRKDSRRTSQLIQANLLSHIRSTVIRSFSNTELPSDQTLQITAYVFSSTYKFLAIVVANKDYLCAFEYGNLRNHFFKIRIEAIQRIKRSIDHPQIAQIFFFDDNQNETSLIFETYPCDSFIDFLSRQPAMPPSKIIPMKLKIESQQLFKNSLLNFMGENLEQGFLDRKSTSFFYNWKPAFVILLRKNLFIFDLPQNFTLKKFAQHLRQIHQYTLKNFEVKELTGDKTSQNLTFCVRLMDEDECLTLRTSSRQEYSRWIRLLKAVADADEQPLF